MDRGAWQAMVYGIAESDMTEQLMLSIGGWIQDHLLKTHHVDRSWAARECCGKLGSFHIVSKNTLKYLEIILTHISRSQMRKFQKRT